MKLPDHKCGLFLEHNVHKDYYQTAKQAIEEAPEDMDMFPFKDEESRQRAIDTDEIWTLQWYPDTPIGSYKVAAPTLEELLEYAAEIK